VVQKRVFVHVGSPKTGTTYLQGILWRNRQLLRRQGVTLPLRTIGEHFAGTFQVAGWTQKRPAPAWVAGAWDRLVESALSADRDALITHEMYCRATEEQAQKALAPLLASGREVHVIVTARDLARQIPAAWQERVKVGGRMTFHSFSQYIRDPERHPQGAGFWRAQDTASLVRRWGSGLPPENVHVVTVPPRGAAPDVLWQRFSQVIGVDHRPFDLGKVVNESLRAEQVEVARRINVALGGRIHWPHPWSQVVKSFYQSALAGRPGTTITMGAEEHELARERSSEIVLTLEQSGVDIVGSLDELRVPEAAEEPAGMPDRLDGNVLADEAAAAIAALLEARAGEYLAAEARRAETAAQSQTPYRRIRRRIGRMARRAGVW